MLNEQELVDIVSYLAEDPQRVRYTEIAIKTVLSLTQYLQVIATLMLLKADCTKDIGFIQNVINKWTEMENAYADRLNDK